MRSELELYTYDKEVAYVQIYTLYSGSSLASTVLWLSYVSTEMGSVGHAVDTF